MKTPLPYGKGELTVSVPDSTSIITGTMSAPVPDVTSSLKKSFTHPSAGPSLEEIVSPGDQVLITHTDITRATPNHIIIPALGAHLEKLGIRPEDITLLNSTGTHRVQTERELIGMLGRETVERYRILQHDALKEEDLYYAGSLDTGNRIYLNRAWDQADVRIATGFIEPHFFAGFSGGPKAVLPGIAGMQSIIKNHGPHNITSPAATWGITRGNPLWEEIAGAAELAPPHFMVNVTLNHTGEISGIFTGELFEAHRLGCNAASDQAIVSLPRPFDIVITSNSGYPLDQNLYQAVKGISAAASITRPGGAIVIAAACSDGIPSHGSFGDLLQSFPEPGEFLNFIHSNDDPVQDQWQAAIFARLALRHRIYICSAGLREEGLKTSFYTITEDIDETVSMLMAEYGSSADVALLPEGPLVIPSVRGQG